MPKVSQRVDSIGVRVRESKKKEIASALET